MLSKKIILSKEKKMQDLLVLIGKMGKHNEYNCLHGKVFAISSKSKLHHNHLDIFLKKNVAQALNITQIHACEWGFQEFW